MSTEGKKSAPEEFWDIIRPNSNEQGMGPNGEDAARLLLSLGQTYQDSSLYQQAGKSFEIQMISGLE